MSAHTPGSWQAFDDDNAQPGGMRCVYTSEMLVICDVRAWADPVATVANARLIAAAPDLLAACKSADETLAADGFPEQMESRAMLRAAIAKAEGGAS